MTVRTVKIEINCGPMTCANEKKQLCQFVGINKATSKHVCILFPDKNSNDLSTPLTEKDGWLQRCDDCRATEE